MASSDEDELALLRASRSSKAGIVATSLEELRELQKRQKDTDPADLDTLGEHRRAGDSDSSNDGENGAIVLEEETIDATDLRGHFPQAFGEQEKIAENLEKVHAETLRKEVEALQGLQDEVPESDLSGAEAFVGPPPPESAQEAIVGPVLPDSTEDDPYNLPTTHEVTLEGQGKAVSCIDIDHSGSRLLSASRDNSLRIFDFNGMKSTMKSFRYLQPSEGHPMLAASWSPSGDAFLAVSGSAQIKIYDRDGIERGESLRGDMYIRDQRNTKGHVSPATGGHWNPTDRSTAMTCSEDGTIRLWDTANVTQKTVIKPQLQKPGRICVSACAYNATGSSIAAGMVDGSIHIWDAKGSRGRSAAVEAVPVPRAQMMGKQDWRFVSGGAQLMLRKAHQADADITSLAFSADNLTLLSRAADDTLKVWDLRKFKAPLCIFDGLPNLVSTTQVCFAPEDRLAVTGTSADRNGQGAALVFVDLAKQMIVRRIVMPTSVVAVQWHARLNQIFVGTGDKSAGLVRALYSPSLSERGVLLCAHRKPRPKDPFDFQAPLVIHNPHALPLFREERGSKRHLDGRPKDAAERMKPDVGATTIKGTGTGGQIGVTGGTLLTQYVLKNQGKLNNPRDEDIRAKILRHSEPEDRTAKLFSKAYAKTQPKPIYAEPDEDESQNENK